jgi:polygalacturonase
MNSFLSSFGPRRILAGLCLMLLVPLLRGAEIVVKAPFPMPAIPLPTFPDKDYLVTDFGAKEGAEEKITDALNRAITRCHADGGGRVVIPRGRWLTGGVRLMSRVNLHIAEGAVLEFSDDPQDYLPAVRTSWEGMECFNYAPLIYAFDCEDVAISGGGTLEARLGTWKKWFARPPAHIEALKQLYHMMSKGVPVAERQMAVGENNLRPQFIQFHRCRRVLIEDVRIRNSPFWTIHLLICDGAVVRRVDVSAHGHNNDGIDPEMTRNLLVEDCSFDQGDDAISIKSGRNHDGWRLNIPAENIVIRRCTMRRGHQLVAIGSELSAGIRNVYVHDCQFLNDPSDPRARPDHILFIKTNRRRGGFVENIHVENITARNTKKGVFGIETDVLYQWRTIVPTYEERITRIRDVYFRNITVEETPTPFRILGDERLPVENVIIENVTIGKVTGQPSVFENVRRIQIDGVTVRE